MNNLKSLEKELDENEKVAAMNIDDIPARTRGGWASRIAEAKEKANKLVDEYQAALAANSVAIFVYGSSAKTSEFEKLVRETGGLLVDADALYNRLTNAVWATIPDGVQSTEWGVQQTYRLQMTLQEVMHELKIKELEMPARADSVVLKDKEAALNYIRRVTKDLVVYGAPNVTLNRFYLNQEMYRAARVIRYKGNIAPVFIMNAAQEDAPKLAYGFGKGVSAVTIADGDTIDTEYLKKTIKEITNQLNKKKQD